MKSYKISKLKAAFISLLLAFFIMAPIIADTIKRAIFPPIGLLILDSILYIGFYILIYNTLRNLTARY